MNPAIRKDGTRTTRWHTPVWQDATSLAHDMKTPLGAIKLYNSLLREMAYDDPHRVGFHRMISEQVDRLACLTDQVGALTDSVQTQMNLFMEHSSLSRLLSDTMALYRQMHADKGYEFLLDVPDTLPPVYADRNALCRVLSNLLDNAVKYSKPHAIYVRAYELRKAGKPFGAVEISDQGQGIAPEHHSFVFEPRYRACPDGIASGQGLGLSIAREIITAHGGLLEVDSILGTGSTFRVLLPLLTRPIYPNRTASC